MTQERSNHHPSLATLRTKGLSYSKMKWWAIYTNLLVNAIVRLPHPRSGESYGQETFLAPSADKQTRILYIYIYIYIYILKRSQDIFSHFNIWNIKKNCGVIFLNFLPITFFGWVIYSFVVTFLYKRFNFFSFANHFWFFHDLTGLLQRIESINYLF